ncbi:hypothetical protein [Formosa sp. A9]|uniref:hypothetical protein n=1 Tax=Formosa sp. A9 TaxID=3442641 RepID=UPI003EBB959F
MFVLRYIMPRFLCCLFVVVLSQCSSAQKLQNQSPVAIEEIYYQQWVSGVSGGGSGLNIFVVLQSERPKTIAFDSIYFRNYQLKLEPDTHHINSYVARYLKSSNTPKTLNQNSNTIEDDLAKSTVNVNPFHLESHECVIRYISNEEPLYFKYDKLYAKETPFAPSAPRKQ